MNNEEHHFDEKYLYVGSAADSILDFEHLTDKGHQQAVLSGTDKQLSEHIKALSDYAEAYAQSKCGEPYDPAKFPEDKIRDDAYQRTLTDLENAKLAAGYAAAEVLVCEKELALAGPELDKPGVLSLTSAISIAALLVSIAPTIHDRFFFNIRDYVTAWTYSGLAGISIAAFIVWTLLEGASMATRRTVTNWLGLIGGIGIGVSLGLIRASNAATFGQYIFTAGLTALEIFAVMILDSFAARHRTALLEWRENHATISKNRELLNSAQRKASGWREKVVQFEQKIHLHRNYVEQKNTAHSKAGELRAVAVKIILNAYAEAVAENRGRLLGIVATKVRVA
jgi:hypothetical protein